MSLQRNDIDFRITENSLLARIAAFNLQSDKVAMVLGKTIHLFGTSKDEFLRDEKWLRHELCHINQYRRYGFVGFITRYLAECLRNGYYNNKFEVEARKAEDLCDK